MWLFCYEGRLSMGMFEALLQPDHDHGTLMGIDSV